MVLFCRTKKQAEEKVLRNLVSVMAYIRNMDPKVMEALKVINLACPSLLVNKGKYLDVSFDPSVPPTEKISLPSSTRHEENLHLPPIISTNHEDMANCKQFSVQALLEKKQKNSKSTPAQECFLFGVREASKAMGWWDNPPAGMKAIAPVNMQRFYTKVLSTLPQLAMHTNEIKKRLSATLINRRNQLKNVLNWKRSRQFKKYRKSLLGKRANVICANMDQHDTDYDNDDNTPPGDDPICGNECPLSDDDDDLDDDDGFHFLSGDDVKVMQGTRYLAKARFMYSCIKDDDYAAVCLKVARISDEDPLVKLTGPKSKTGKETLQNVKVGEEFYWPKNQLIRFPTPRQSLNKLPAGKRQAPTLTPSDHLQTIKQPAAKLKKVSSSKGFHKQTKKAKKLSKLKKTSTDLEKPLQETKQTALPASTDKPPETKQTTVPVCPWKGYAFVLEEDESTAKDKFLEPVSGKRMPKPKCLFDF